MLTQSVSHLVNRSDRPIDHIEHDILSWLTVLGFKVFPAPNNVQQINNMWLNALQPAGVILSGGNDLGACNLRDEVEKSIFEYAIQNNLPVLGICRGMQFIVQYFGGTMIRAVGHVNVEHEIKGSINKRVNSYHNYVVTSPGEDMQVLAESPEGYIEAVMHNTMPIHGWMWHPEREAVYCPVDKTNMENIFGCKLSS